MRHEGGSGGRRLSPVRVLAVALLALLSSSVIGMAAGWRADASPAIPRLVPEVQGGTVAVGEVHAVVPQAVPDVRALRPIDVPADPYAPEAVVQIGTIEIPKIGLSTVLMNGVTLHNIDVGPSHWPGSAMPGQIGNVVVAGHRVTHTHPFRDIDQLVPGDQVIFTVGGHRSVYAMVSHEVVTPDEVRIADQTTTPTATLFACHPPHSAKFRYVVHLVLVSTT